MIGLDTNILLRFMLQDDAQQSKQADRIILRTCTSENPGYVNLITVAEIAWVLGRAYRLTPSEVADALEVMLQIDTLLVQNQDQVFFALNALRSGGASFGDALINALNQRAGCETTLTFDVKASRLAGFTLVQPRTSGS